MAWIVRRWHVEDPFILKFKLGFSDEEVEIVYHYVVENGYCHDEFFELLREIPLDTSL